MSLINVTRKERNGKTSVSDDLIQTDKIAVPIREISGEAYISVIESPLTGRGSETLVIGNYLVEEDLTTICDSTSSLFKATVLTRGGRTPNAGWSVLGFVADKIMGPIMTEGSGSKFLYHEDNGTYPVEFVVSESPANIIAQTGTGEVPAPADGVLRYKALLSQTYEEIAPIPGVFEIGNIYIINTILNGDDFTNIGFVTPGVPFVATGTTATAWSSSGEGGNTVVIDATASAPVSTVLENTLGTPPTPTYSGAGSYTLDFPSAVLTNNKTSVTNGTSFDTAGDIATQRLSTTQVGIYTISRDGLETPIDGVLFETTILIEVYP